MSVVHGPGAWNDPDMLIVGNYGLSYTQSQTQLALWALMSAPMIMSVDLRTMKPWFRDLVQNKNVIGINQDALGSFGKQILALSGVKIWRKRMSGERYAFAFMYPEPYGTPASVRVGLADLGLVAETSYSLFEMFSGDLIGNYDSDSMFNCTVYPSGGTFAFWAERNTNKLKSSV